MYFCQYTLRFKGKRISGDGMEISGLSAGETVRGCFPFPVYNYSWTGKVYQWSGTGRLPFTTSILNLPDSGNVAACSYNVGNGTYSLIIGYSH